MANINDLKRQNDEKAERILNMEQQYFINDTKLNQTKQENMDLVDSYSKIIRNSN
jgi:hypothetical protein